MLYVLIIIGATYSGNTNIVTSQTQYSLKNRFSSDRASLLAVDPPIPASNPHGAKVYDVALYLGSYIDSRAKAGDIAFVSNTQENLRYPAISAAGPGQAAALDTSYESFDAGSNTLTLQVDPQVGIAAQLNRFEIDSGLLANEYQILEGTFTVTFSKDTETISGEATFFGSGYIYPGSAAVQVTIQGVAFNGLEYLASNLDLVPFVGVDGNKATNHYLTYGFNEGRPYDFDGLDYISSYPDLIVTLGANRDAGTTHYINRGSKEGRKISFDSWEYIASYPDLIVAFGLNKAYGATHYIQHGYREGRSTHIFNAAQYLANYADLRNAFGDNLEAAREHYILTGYREGRTDKAPGH